MTAVAIETARPESCESRRLLVVIDELCAAPELARREPIEAFVISPAHGSAVPKWYVDEDAARAEAIRRLRACVACLAAAGIRADGRLSDPDLVQAIADALDSFPANEILIITAPQRPLSWFNQNVIDRARRSFPQPIEHVVMREA